MMNNEITIEQVLELMHKHKKDSIYDFHMVMDLLKLVGMEFVDGKIKPILEECYNG